MEGWETAGKDSCTKVITVLFLQPEKGSRARVMAKTTLIDCPEFEITKEDQSNQAFATYTRHVSQARPLITNTTPLASI